MTHTRNPGTGFLENVPVSFGSIVAQATHDYMRKMGKSPTRLILGMMWKNWIQDDMEWRASIRFWRGEKKDEYMGMEIDYVEGQGVEVLGPGESVDRRIKVTLVERMQFFRHPRTKRRRILKKWRRRQENYRPLMVPVGCSIAMGRYAAYRAYGIPRCMGEPLFAGPESEYGSWRQEEKIREDAKKLDPYFNPERPNMRNDIEVTPALWEMMKSKHPEIVSKCDLYESGNKVAWTGAGYVEVRPREWI